MRIEEVAEFARLVPELSEDDVSCFVLDHEKVAAAYIHPKFDIKIKAGDSTELYTKSVVYQALKTGKRIVYEVSQTQSQFGIPYVAIAVPVLDEGKVVGAISVVLSTERYERLRKSAMSILAAVEQISASTQELSSQSEELSATAREMDNQTVHVKNDIQNVGGTANKLKKMSAQANILGINASIESARAGELGRGFGIVSGEVRKLADNTKNSVMNIEADMKKAEASVTNMIESINQLAEVSEAQAIAVTEVSQALQQISAMAQELVDMGKVKSDKSME